jgi:hypothetical protein
MTDDREIAIDKIMKLVPCKDQFERMLGLSPSETKAIVRKRPVFPYSREQVENMTKAEYREAFAKWENDRYGVPKDDDSDEDTMYQRFREWNLKCLNDMYEDEFEHLEWLCDRIANKKVRNLDMEDCGEFLTGGIYFNEDKELVVYNGR